MRQRVFPTSVLDSAQPFRARIVAVMATVTAATTLLFGSWGAIHAQDGTSGAPPLEESNCVLAPASDIEDLRAVQEPTPAATPATPVANTLILGPAATPVASPVRDDTAAATPVLATPEPTPVAETSVPLNEELLTEDLVAASTSLASCLSEGEFGQVVDHASPTFRGQLVGSSRPLGGSDYVALAETFPPIDYSILEVENPTLVDDTTATADVVWSMANQVRSDQWTFTLTNVQGVTMWTVAEAAPGTLTPSLEPATIYTTISGNRYSLIPDTVAEATVLFNVQNNDPVDHELLVLKLDRGVSTDTLLRTPGPQLPAGVTMVGQATIANNSNGRLLLTDLEPGLYTIVCLLPDENGVPHLADGMETTFLVEAP